MFKICGTQCHALLSCRVRTTCVNRTGAVRKHAPTLRDGACWDR